MLKKLLNEKIIRKNKKLSPLKSAISSVIFSPLFNVAALVLMLLSVFSGLRFLSARQTPGQVKFVEQPNLEPEARTTTKENVYKSPEIFQGEVYDTSIRLRETGALGMAITLSVFAINGEQGSVPANLEQIWTFISERKLMPPELEFNNGELMSPSSRIQVTYQSQPLRFEILSRPKKTGKNPAILLRFPLVSLDGRTITYFQSSTVTARDIPAPFAPVEKVVSAGWTLAQWRGELLPKPDNTNQILEDEKRLLDQIKQQ